MANEWFLLASITKHSTISLYCDVTVEYNSLVLHEDFLTCTVFQALHAVACWVLLNGSASDKRCLAHRADALSSLDNPLVSDLSSCRAKGGMPSRLTLYPKRLGIVHNNELISKLFKRLLTIRAL